MGFLISVCLARKHSIVLTSLLLGKPHTNSSHDAGVRYGLYIFYQAIKDFGGHYS
jgi:hypothetical protein